MKVNYRHLQDDMDPKGFKEEGFKHLDRVVELVSCPMRAMELIAVRET